MKPRNFPTRKLRRQAFAKWRRGEDRTDAEIKAMSRPKDIRIRVGKGRER